MSGDLEPFKHIVPCGIQDDDFDRKETGNTFTPEDVSCRVAEIAYH
jgi:lipoate-protein ligase B